MMLISSHSYHSEIRPPGFYLSVYRRHSLIDPSNYLLGHRFSSQKIGPVVQPGLGRQSKNPSSSYTAKAECSNHSRPILLSRWNLTPLKPDEALEGGATTFEKT